MFLKVIQKNGVSRLYFYESVYLNGKTSQRCLESLGRLDELQKRYRDPVAHFKRVAEERSAEQKAESQALIPVDTAQSLDIAESNLKNVGYAILRDLYKQLELDKFWKKIREKAHVENDLNKIFQLLVYSRLLYPESKTDPYERRGVFFEEFDGFGPQEIDRSLTVFDRYGGDLQKWIYDHASNTVQRDMTVAWYYFTNCCFDMESPGETAGSRQDRSEENRRTCPFVKMGILTDRNGIPLAFDLFPGDEPEDVHGRAIADRVKEQFPDCRVVFVADRGLSASDDIGFPAGEHGADPHPEDGYVFGQSIRGADDEFQAWVLSGGYRTEKLAGEDGGEITLKVKSRIHTKTIQESATAPGRKKEKNHSVAVRQKQMVCYSGELARRQRRERDVRIVRAGDWIAHPEKYDGGTAAGPGACVRNPAFHESTGEAAERSGLAPDTDRIRREERLDGYYTIVTSELEMSDLNLWETFRELSGMGETFGIPESEPGSGPVFVCADDPAGGHPVTGFTALVLLRLLQAKLGGKYPAGAITKSLRNYNCTRIHNSIYQFVYYDEILKHCGEAFHLEMGNRYRTREQIRRMLKY